MLRALFVFIFISGVSHPAILKAEIYKWTDENGQVHYSSSKPQSYDHEEVNVHVKKTKKTPKKRPSPPPMPREGKAYYTSLGELCGDEPSVQKNGMTYCCSTRCIRESQEQDRPFQCFTGKCQDEVRKINEEKRKEHAKRRAEERRQREEAREKRRQEYADNANALRRHREETMESADKKLVEDCEKRRNIYCDEGADSIRKRREIKAIREKEHQDYKKNNPDIIRNRSHDIYIQ